MTLHWVAKGSGPTVAFLHGLGESHHFWLGIASRLRGYRCLLVDLPGHGLSPALPSRDEAVGAIAQLLNQQRAQASVGHSLGAALGCLAAPNVALQALVLVGWGGHASMQLRGALAEGDLAGAYRLLYTEAYLAKRPTFLQQVTNKRVRNPALEFAEWAEAEPPELVIPVLLVAGEEDQVAPVAQIKHLRKRFPKGRVLVMKGVGHVPSVEMPKPFTDILAHFLSSTLSGTV